MESPIGWNLKVLELRSTNLSNWALVRLARYVALYSFTSMHFYLSIFVMFFSDR